MITPSLQQLKTLYDKDFILWIDQTIEQIRQGDIKDLDWENLLEEIESLGREQRNKVESYLIQLIKHLLMYKYWQSEKVYCERGWAGEIDNFRIELEILFQSKTLYNYALTKLDLIYTKARKSMLRKSQLSPNLIPETCPFVMEELLDFAFLPNENFPK